VPVRQWVLLLPIPLRQVLAAQPVLVTPVRLTRVAPGEGPRSARVCPMPRRLSGQAAGLRLPSVRFARPMLPPRNNPERPRVPVGPEASRFKNLIPGLDQLL